MGYKLNMTLDSMSSHIKRNMFIVSSWNFGNNLKYKSDYGNVMTLENMIDDIICDLVDFTDSTIILYVNVYLNLSVSLYRDYIDDHHIHIFPIRLNEFNFDSIKKDYYTGSKLVFKYYINEICF